MSGFPRLNYTVLDRLLNVSIGWVSYAHHLNLEIAHAFVAAIVVREQWDGLAREREEVLNHCSICVDHQTLRSCGDGRRLKLANAESCTLGGCVNHV